MINNMKTTHLSSTELKRNTAEILNLVAFGKAVAIIERYGEPLVRITPIVSSKKKAELGERLKKYFGAIPDFPSVSKLRYFRKRSLSL